MKRHGKIFKDGIMRTGVVILLCAVGLSGGDAGCDLPPSQPMRCYTPGVGDIMSTLQMRHAKLWFAAKAGNWELASYELDEITEGLAEVAVSHPLFKGQPLAGMLEAVTSQPVNQIHRAVTRHNVRAFARSFDALSRACNTCHQSMGYPFITITRPVRLPVGNQMFHAVGR